MAVCFPCPTLPSITIVELSDKPKWITFNNSINFVVKAGFIFGYLFFIQGMNAFVIKDFIPFNLFLFPNKNGFCFFGNSIWNFFSLLTINKYSYNLSFISLFDKLFLLLFSSTIDFSVV